MATGDNINRMRLLKRMTQKELGMAIGFDKRTADVRVAQYESGTRTPKENLINEFSRALDVNPMALTAPDIDSHMRLIHTLFTIEDKYGLRIGEIDGEVCLRLDKDAIDFRTIFTMLLAWKGEADKLKGEEISKEEYDHWRYNYPYYEVERQKKRWAENK